jgi:hypothetical protein
MCFVSTSPGVCRSHSHARCRTHEPPVTSTANSSHRLSSPPAESPPLQHAPCLHGRCPLGLQRTRRPPPSRRVRFQMRRSCECPRGLVPQGFAPLAGPYHHTPYSGVCWPTLPGPCSPSKLPSSRIAPTGLSSALRSFGPRRARSVAVCRPFPVISRWKLTPCRVWFSVRTLRCGSAGRIRYPSFSLWYLRSLPKSPLPMVRGLPPRAAPFRASSVEVCCVARRALRVLECSPCPSAQSWWVPGLLSG